MSKGKTRTGDTTHPTKGLSVAFGAITPVVGAGRGETKNPPSDCTPERTAFEKIESAILDSGGRSLAKVGKADRYGAGFVAAYYITATGKPIILQIVREGGVEVFVPVTSSPRIDATIDALRWYDEGSLVRPGALSAAHSTMLAAARSVVEEADSAGNEEEGSYISGAALRALGTAVDLLTRTGTVPAVAPGT